jgi:ceramide glucosyltransferase
MPRGMRWYGMDILVAAAVTGLALTGVSHFGTIALVLHRRIRRGSRRGARPRAAVSILRPVCGLEHGLEATLRSSFQIDHPSYEVLFCVEDAADPAVPLVRRLIAEHPEVPARLLVGDDGEGINPKLDNLLKAWDVAAHDWIVLADSNVLCPPDYLRRLFARWTERCAFVCSPVVGIDAQSHAAELEEAFLNTYQARWQLAVDELGYGFVQGKSILLRRSELATVGGLRALARELAEDAAATKIARQRDRVARVVNEPFAQPLGRRSLADVWQRQLRWARMRSLSFPALYCAELPAGGLPPFVLGCGLASADALPWGGVAALMPIWYGAEALLAHVLAWPLRLRSPLFWIARDLLLPVLWVRGWAVRRYEWRGHAIDLRSTT